MKVLLAGFNVDTEVINDLLSKSPERRDVTPETLSASYARISRDPRPIDELRKAARQEVDRARKSNQAIIFKMGHHSVAEHAVFNFDLIGISRLAIEEVEHFRLCSYTEKSQRYITLENDYVLPEEIKGTKHQSLFTETINLQNDLYFILYKKLKSHIFDRYKELAKDPKQHNLLEGWAKEDARYITSLATQGQLGQTVNARNLELLLRRFASHKLKEVREIGEKLYSLTEKVAPSIIIFHKANDFDEKTYPELIKSAGRIIKDEKSDNKTIVKMVSYTEEADNITIAALLYSSSRLDFEKCFKTAEGMTKEEKNELLKTACEHMEFYDTALREFEYANMTFDIIISASCFAQLKRHRMASLTAKDYDIELGITLPESIKEIGMEKEFHGVIEKTEDAYRAIYRDIPDAAKYILTNAHRRRVLFSCNARELYHISRLREDSHAQWDIRNISSLMSALAKEKMPLTMFLLGGKDKYAGIYKETYGKPPRITAVQ